MCILNLTQHRCTAEQLSDGIENIPSKHAEQLEKLLTFPSDYDLTMLVNNAKALANLARSLGYEAVMVGGMPSFMPILQAEMIKADISVGYARTERVSVDQIQPDGSVKKVSVFKHAGLYWAWERTPCPYCRRTDCVVVTHGEHLCG